MAAALLTDEIRKLGGILTIQDLVDYSVQWEEPQTAQILNGKRIYTHHR